MTDASNNGRKSQKGALGGLPYGHSDRASEPYADIDVPEYEGATPEPAAKGASKSPAAPAAKTVKNGPAVADKKPAAKAAPTAKTAAKPKAKSGDAKSPASAQAKAAKGDAPKAAAAKAAGPQPAEAKRADTAAADAKTTAKGKDAAERTDTAGAAERGTAEQGRPRDIYALAGRARPQRIEAPAPEPAPEAEFAPAADVPKTDGEQPGAAEEQRTEVLDLSGADAGTGSQSAAAQQQAQSQTGTKTAALGAGVAGAGAAGAGGVGAPKNDADTAAQGYPAQPGEAYPQGAVDADAQWDPNEQPVGSEGEVAYGPDGQPLAPIAEPVETRRGTQSLGLAILRIVAGAVLLISGLQTLFGFAGDPGISALESRLSFFSGSGVLAVAIPAAEVIAGGLLILGLLTPFAAALAFVVSAFMATFHLSGHQGSLWPYGLNPVIHQWALYALISLSLIFTGPGGASLDRSRSWATRPLASSWIFALLGIAGFAALWLLTGGRNPF